MTRQYNKLGGEDLTYFGVIFLKQMRSFGPLLHALITHGDHCEIKAHRNGPKRYINLRKHVPMLVKSFLSNLIIEAIVLHNIRNVLPQMSNPGLHRARPRQQQSQLTSQVCRPSNIL